MRSTGRGSGVIIRNEEAYQKAVENANKSSLSRYFCGIVTSPYKQDVSALLVGNKGTGKSYASLSIAYNTSIKIAEVLGGKPNDYFNIDHVACVDPAQANDLMTRCEKNCCYIYDDIGVGWGARDWQSRSSKDKNNIFQINRIAQTLQIFSVPNQFLLDKVPRSLVSHYMETDRQFFNQGFITVKVFKPVTLFRAGKIIQPLLSTVDTKYVLYTVEKPPDELTAEYDHLREKVTRNLISNGGTPDVPVKEARENLAEKRKRQKEERMREFVPKVLKLMDEGMPQWKALKEVGIPATTWRSWNIEEFMAATIDADPTY